MEKQCSVMSRVSDLYTSGNLSDISFVVGAEGQQKTFYVHKLLLASASEVFKAMFYGYLPETSKSVFIPDINSKGFEKMLRYLYLDDATFDSPAVVMMTLQVAKKYMLHHLTEVCSWHITSTITTDNVCSVLETAYLYDLNRVKISALFYISRNTEAVVTTQGFYDCTFKTVEKIISQDYLEVSEEKLITAVLQWGCSQLKQQSIDVTWSNIRYIIEPLLPHLRIHILTLEQFAASRLEDGVLSNEELLSITNNISHPGSEPLPKWCCQKDKRTELQDMVAYCIPYTHVASMYQPGDPVIIECKFSVSQGSFVILRTLEWVFDFHLDSDDYLLIHGMPFDPRDDLITAYGKLSLRNSKYNIEMSWPVTVQLKRLSSECSSSVSLPVPVVLCEYEVCEISLKLDRFIGDNLQNRGSRRRKSEPISISERTFKLSQPFQFDFSSETTYEKYHFDKIMYLPLPLLTSTSEQPKSSCQLVSI